MTATIYSPPESLPVPNFDYPYDYYKDNERKEEQWLKELKDYCEKSGSGAYAGKVIREPVADGYAMYMIFSIRPLILIHIPLGDAWHFQWAKRWTVSDVKNLAGREDSMRKLLGEEQFGV